jgi:hypothetical protein
MIREFKWTIHARRRLRRLRNRGVDQAEIEAALRSEHAYRVRNAGKADWQVTITSGDGRRFGVAYDHPVDGDDALAKVVTVFRKGRFRRR